MSSIAQTFNFEIKMKHIIFLIVAILFEILATSLLKVSDQFTKLVPTVISIVAYIIAFYLLSLSLKVLPVGVAYAIWSGVGIVFISLIGYFFFKQSLDLAAIIGIAFIVTGVLIVNVFSKTSA